MDRENIIRKIRESSSSEDLMKRAGARGYILGEKEAVALWNKFNSPDELEDDDIDSVVGGCGSETSSFSGAWAVGKKLMNSCPVCHNNCWAESVAWGYSERRYECQVCWVRKQYNLPSAPTMVPVTSECGQSSDKPRSEIWVKD